MSVSRRPPVIAAWLLHRFGPMPETDAIAGDLAEQYQHRRSRAWYWREVTVAMLMGTGSEIRQHSLLLLLAIAVAGILNFVWQWFVTPYEYSILVRHVLGHQAGPQDIPLVSFLIDGTMLMATGWTVARCAQRCRIPAIFSVAGIYLLLAAWSTWKDATGNVWRESFGYHFSVSSLWPIPLGIVLLLLSGGLLTGSPKRTVRT